MKQQQFNVTAMMGSGAVCLAIGFATCWLIFPRAEAKESRDTSRKGGPEPPQGGHISSSTNAENITPGFLNSSLRKNKESFVWASGLPILRVVITGVSAALPDGASPAFNPGVNNIHRIISGECFITEVRRDVRDSMLEKNVVVVNKGKDGTLHKVPITSHDQNISLSASMGEGDFNLSSYGVPQSICDTMDRAVQVSVAAGLEALRDAGIVSGEGVGTQGWVLPEHLQPTTGIVYATSFPALDTAITEVTRFFRTRDVHRLGLSALLTVLRNRFAERAAPEGLGEGVCLAFSQLEETLAELSTETDENSVYEFDRKFLFRVLVLGNAQLAQIIKARGPNMQTNAACAGKKGLCLYLSVYL